MAEKVTFNPVSKIISINLGETEIDIQNHVYSAWKRWLIVDDNCKYVQAMRTVGGDSLTTTKSLGSTFFLMNGWRIKPPEEDTVLNIIGNIYHDDGIPVLTTTIGDFNSLVTVTVSNLTDSQVVESEIAQSLDYGGVVHYKEGSEFSGSEYPYGTVNYPLNNISDVIAMCNKVGTKNISVKGDLYMDRNLSGYVFNGENASCNIFFEGYDISECVFNSVRLRGNCTGSIRANSCDIFNVSGISGEFYLCGLSGMITFGNTETCLVMCFTRHTNTEHVIFNGGDLLDANVCLRAYTGHIFVDGFKDAGTTFTVDFISGKLTITNNNSNIKELVVRGVGIVNNLSSVIVDTSGIISNNSISEAIMEAPLDKYTDSNTLGGFIKNKLLTVAKFIGLQ